MKNYEGCLSQDAQVDYLVSSLLDFFRNPKNSDRWSEAVRIAVSQVERGLGLRSQAYAKKCMFLAANLRNNLSAKSIRNFAQECFHATSNFIENPASPVKNENFKSDSLARRLKKEIAKSLEAGHLQGAAVNRAVNRLFKEKREESKGRKNADKATKHPLSDTFGALSPQNFQRIAKEDIRNHFMRLKRARDNTNGGGVLLGLLERARAFTPFRLRNLLGDEMFFLCRPLGFYDKRGTILLVEVATSAHLHGLSYRKMQIINSLKRDDAFALLKDIKFKIAVN